MLSVDRKAKKSRYEILEFVLNLLFMYDVRCTSLILKNFEARFNYLHSNYQRNISLYTIELKHLNHKLPQSSWRVAESSAEQMRKLVCSRFDVVNRKFDEGRIDECSRFLIQLNINHSHSRPTSEFKLWLFRRLQSAK